MPSRLIPALILSLALHASVFAPEVFKRNTANPTLPTLQAVLRPLSAPSEELLLKNTLEAEPEKPRATSPPLPPPEKASKVTRPSGKADVKAAQKKLAKHLYYPPEAISRGLEGEVRLLLTLSADGNITDINIAASSGHAILDNAAVKATWAMASLGADSRELILPVIFRLQ